MKKKIIFIVLLFYICITGIFLVLLNGKEVKKADIEKRNQVVQLNEIKELTKITLEDSSKKEDLELAIKDFQSDIKSSSSSMNETYLIKLWTVYFVSIAFISIVFLYIYRQVIRPFNKLENFASEIAKGNFDSPLYIERNNMFGDFTWAFDMMRNEIKRARSCEKEAIENNKTVIATMSHDIKTPIASIRAYAEGLGANMDSNYERRQRYISVIMKKCDEVSKLTNDLFLHSLTNMDKLKMQTKNHKADKVIYEILKTIMPDDNKININGMIPALNIQVDEKRLEQVFENIISNSVKYSDGSKIDMSFEDDGKYLYCYISDYGIGIVDEDIPFIFDKFYRGKNAKDKQGSGLGLYIVKYIMEKMNGAVEIKNREYGLTVILKLKIS